MHHLVCYLETLNRKKGADVLERKMSTWKGFGAYMQGSLVPWSLTCGGMLGPLTI